MKTFNTLLLIIFLCSFGAVFAQEQALTSEKTKSKTKSEKTKYPIYFGFQVSPIFPAKFIGTRNLTTTIDGFTTNISQIAGYSLGGVVRIGLTKTIAIETGISTTQRKYNIISSLPDSNLYADQNIRFVTYDIPLNALFYIRLAEQFYMNASVGGAFVFNPTLSRVRYNEPNTNHSFTHTALSKKVQFDVSANLGFEFRTKKAGTFYLGAIVRVPVKPVMHMSSFYEYGGYRIKNDPLTQGKISGAYLAMEVKYFFPLNMKSKGPIYEKGPIEF